MNADVVERLAEVRDVAVLLVGEGRPEVAEDLTVWEDEGAEDKEVVA